MKHQPPLIDKHGQPLNADSAYAAASWLTLLMSDEVSDDDRLNWQQWLAQSADNARAWQHIEAVCASFKQVDAGLARQSLSALSNPRRRTLLKVLATLCVTGASLQWDNRQMGWQALTADYHTAPGEQRHLTLSEGSELLMDTQTALNVRYSDSERQVELLNGDLLITTSQREKQAAAPRPFSVVTPEGRILALGTRFRVQLLEGKTHVAVYQGAIRLYAHNSSITSPALHAGQGAWLSRETFGDIHGGEKEPGWVRGKLLADNMSLADFLRNLNRYRPGVIHFDESIASLRLSGVFPLTDTDSIITSLPTILPIRINRLSRRWVSLSHR